MLPEPWPLASQFTIRAPESHRIQVAGKFSWPALTLYFEPLVAAAFVGAQEAKLIEALGKVGVEVKEDE